MNYFTDGKLDNTVYDIDENYLKKMLDDNARELKESVQLTNSSYKGESLISFHLKKIKPYIELLLICGLQSLSI